MIRRRWFIVLCYAMMWTGAPALAANPSSVYTQKKEPAEVIVAGANPEGSGVEVALSGTVAVTLRVDGARTLEVDPMQALTASEAWKERRRQPAQSKDEGERKVWKQEFVLEPQRVGEIMLTLTPLRFRENSNDAWQTITWDPIPVKVTTEITQADPKDLRDITPPEPVAPEENSYLWLAWAGGGFIVLALALGAWEIRRRVTGGAAPAIAPERWALKQLERARKMDLTGDGDGIKHHTLVSDVLRRYLEHRYRLQAPGKTTTEFLETMRQGGHLTAQQFHLLRDALDRCDLAKFARVSPTPEECQNLDQGAVALVTQTTRAGAT